MNKNNIETNRSSLKSRGFAAITFIAGLAVGSLALSRAVAQPAATAPVPQAPVTYEYKVVNTIGLAAFDPEKELNTHSANGWRFASVVGMGHLFIFERQR